MSNFKRLIVKYREQLAYVGFGCITTLVNILAFEGLTRLGASTAVANAVAWAASVVVAYVTNRRWVFHSEAKGAAILREFAAFTGGRLATGLLDEGLMVLCVDLLGPRLFPASFLPLWKRLMKLISNVFVIVLNYIFSKLIIFKKAE